MKVEQSKIVFFGLIDIRIQALQKPKEYKTKGERKKKSEIGSTDLSQGKNSKCTLLFQQGTSLMHPLEKGRSESLSSRKVEGELTYCLRQIEKTQRYKGKRFKESANNSRGEGVPTEWENRGRR